MVHMQGFIVLLLLGVAACEEKVGKINEIMDEALENLRKNPDLVKKLEPIFVEDFDTMGVKVTNTTLWGASKIYRNGDCILKFDGEVITVTANLKTKKLNFHWNYKGSVVYMFVRGDAEGYFKDVAAKLTVRASNGSAKLVSLKLTELGRYEITNLSGYTVFGNWFMKRFYNFFAKIFRPHVVQTFEENMFPVMAKLIADLELPSGI